MAEWREVLDSDLLKYFLRETKVTQVDLRAAGFDVQWKTHTKAPFWLDTRAVEGRVQRENGRSVLIGPFTEGHKPALLDRVILWVTVNGIHYHVYSIPW